MKKSKKNIEVKKGVRIEYYVPKGKGKNDSFWYFGQNIALLSYKNREVLINSEGDVDIIFNNSTYDRFRDDQALSEAEYRNYTDKNLKKATWNSNNWFECCVRVVISKKEWEQQLKDTQKWRDKLKEYRQIKQMDYKEYLIRYCRFERPDDDVAYDYTESIKMGLDLIKDEEHDCWQSNNS